MKLPRQKRDETSATLTQTLGLILACSALCALTAGGSPPAWWASRDATHAVEVTTNSGIVTTNYITNDYAAVNQGQLKQFTARAVDELNADLASSGGAGTNLNTMVSNWVADYATNGYATNPANPARPYKPADFQVINVGQLKYVAGLVYGQLSAAGYTGLVPSWLHTNATDYAVANLGQLKEVFAFDLTAAANGATGLTAVASSNPGEIDLSWTAPAVNNATSYTLSYSTDGGSTWTTLTTTGNPSTDSFAATGLDPTQTYQFQLTYDNSNATGGGGAGAGASSPATTSGSIPPKPAPRYAVIDLGAGMVPTALSSTGYVASTNPSYTAGYRWFNGVSQTLASCEFPTGVDDAGTVVGEQPPFLLFSDLTAATVWLPNETTVSFLQDQTLQAEAPLLGLQLGPPAPGTGAGIELASLIDYNGTIYGELGNLVIGDMGGFGGSGSSGLGSGSNYVSAVEWQNYGDPDTMLGGLWIPDQIGTSSEQIISAKNNNVIVDIDTLSVLSVPVPFTPAIVPTYTINGVPVSFTAIDISTTGVVIGSSSTNSWPLPNTSFLYNLDGTDGTETIPGAVYLYTLNHATRNMHSGGTVTPVECPQVLGTDSSSSNTLFQKNPDTGSYEAYHMDDLIGAASGWSGFGMSAAQYAMNDSGAIVGTATYTPTGTTDPIAAGSHGVLLTPCEVRLLNGDTNAADVDGKDFDGNRPTTIDNSDLSPDNTTTSTDITDVGTDILGDCPMGTGRTDPPFAGNSYISTELVVAKVQPNAAAAGFTYAWTRVKLWRELDIKKSSDGSHWNVTRDSVSAGSPALANDTDDGSHQTTVPSAKNILYSYDASGDYMANHASAAVGDYSLDEKKFIYTLTISMGSKVVATVNFPIGQFIVAKRVNTTGTTSTDWQGISCRASSVNIPDCQMPNDAAHVAIIRGIVGGSLPITIDSHANDN
jgi:hypothetical protein